MVCLDIFHIVVEHHQDDGDGDKRQRTEYGRQVLAPAALFEAVARHQQCAGSTDGTGLVDCGNAADDGTEHQKDQRQWRHQGREHLAEESAIVAALLADCRCAFGAQDCEKQYVQHVQRDQHQARYKCAEEHFTRTG